MPAPAKRLIILGALGLGLLVVGMVLALVLVALDAPAALALVPIAAGAALYVVSCVRWWDVAVATEQLLAETSAAQRSEAVLEHARAARPDLDADQAVAAWSAAAWGVADPHPFVAEPTAASRPEPPVRSARSASPAGFGRSARAATGITAGLAALALVVVAGAGVAPVAEHALSAGQDLARGLQDEAGAAAPFVSDDGTVTVTEVDDDDSWNDTCGTTPGQDDCWSWEVESTKTCNLQVRIGFAETETGDDVRTVTRTVQVSKHRPLYIAELGNEAYSGIESTSCATSLPHRLVTGESDDSVADGDWPEACDDSGCVGWVLHPEEDCADASVQFAVSDSGGVLEDPHDLVVGATLQSGKPVTVVAGGVPDDDGTAEIVQITCATDRGDPPAGPSDDSDATARA